MRFLSLRAMFLIGFVIGMPVLALPPVARQLDTLLYGPAPTDFGRPRVAAAKAQETVQPLGAEAASPAALEQTAANSAARELDTAMVQPPPLPSAPAFAPLIPPSPKATPEDPTVGEATLAKLEQIRKRLEELGAEYVIAESVHGSGQFHFHCRMLVDSQSRFTRPFEATAADPATAAEQVLRDVEAWQLAASRRTSVAR